MRRTLAPMVALAAMAAALAAGCGSASTPASGSHTSAASAGLATTSTTTSSKPLNFAAAIPPGLPTSIPGGTAPEGFVRYQGKGFSFLAPRGYKPAPASGVGGMPSDVSVVFLTPGGKPIDQTNSQLIVATNPQLKLGIDEVATELQAADSNNPSLTGVHTAVSAVTVDHAQGGRIVSESYSTKPPNATGFKRTWLIVLPKPGVLMDLVVVNEPGHGGSLNPASVLGSFRLDS